MCAPRARCWRCPPRDFGAGAAIFAWPSWQPSSRSRRRRTIGGHSRIWRRVGGTWTTRCVRRSRDRSWPTSSGSRRSPRADRRPIWAPRTCSKASRGGAPARPRVAFARPPPFRMSTPPSLFCRPMGRRTALTWPSSTTTSPRSTTRAIGAPFSRRRMSWPRCTRCSSRERGGERRRHYRAVVAEKPEQLSDAQRVRHRVFVEEQGLLAPGHAGLDGRCIDAGDATPGTTHLLVYDDRQPIGTVRLSDRLSVRLSAPGGTGMPRDAGRETPLPGFPFQLGGLPDRAAVGVVERFCVLRRFHGTRVMPALHAGLRAESRRLGLSHWVALANAETNCPVEAGLIFDAALAQGLMSETTTCRPWGAAPRPSGCDRHVYTEAERRQATAGRGSAARTLPLPRPLPWFAAGLGGGYLGRPRYDAPSG